MASVAKEYSMLEVEMALIAASLVKGTIAASRLLYGISALHRRCALYLEGLLQGRSSRSLASRYHRRQIYILAEDVMKKLTT